MIDKNLMQWVIEERERSLNYYRDWIYEGEEIFIPTRHGKMRARAYFPENKQETMPVFFDIHGGGHTVHKCEADQPLCLAICEKIQGVVIALDYHLAPEYRWPFQIEELYDAILYVNKHPNDYQIDPSRMGIGGHSAGGNLAAVLAIMINQKKEFSIACQLLTYPETDVYTNPKDKYEGKAEEMISMILNFSRCYRDDKDAKNPMCSPLFAEKELLEGMAPAIVILCGNDILYREGLNYAIHLIEAGVETTVRSFLEADHAFTADFYDTELGQKGIQFIAESIHRFL